MKTGDILLVHSKFDPIAWLIRKYTSSYWNHVAWAIDKDNFIEARGTEIGRVSRTKYLNWLYNVKLIRLKNISETELKEALNYISQFKRKRRYIDYLKLIFKIFISNYGSFVCGLTCSNLIGRGLESINYWDKGKEIYSITPRDISELKSKDVSDELNYYILEKD